MFLGAVSPEGARTQVEDVRARAVAYGRQGGDILFFQGLTLIVGSTEEEAERKLADYREHTSLEGFAAHMSGSLQLDLSRVNSTPRSARSTRTACRASCGRWWRVRRTRRGRSARCCGRAPGRGRSPGCRSGSPTSSSAGGTPASTASTSRTSPAPAPSRTSPTSWRRCCRNAAC
ncbi:LLM class flavin-dependent oxidoreductase [Streptomyces purpurascens]